LTQLEQVTNLDVLGEFSASTTPNLPATDTGYTFDSGSVAIGIAQESLVTLASTYAMDKSIDIIGKTNLSLHSNKIKLQSNDM